MPDSMYKSYRFDKDGVLELMIGHIIQKGPFQKTYWTPLKGIKHIIQWYIDVRFIWYKCSVREGGSGGEA